MNIICSPKGIVNTLHPRQGIIDIVNADFKNISLDLGRCSTWRELEEYEYFPISEHPIEIGRYFEKLIAECQSKNLQIPAAHAPYLSRDTKRKDLDEVLFNLYKESMLHTKTIESFTSDIISGLQQLRERIK